MQETDSSALSFHGLRLILSQIADVKEALDVLETRIAHFEKQVDDPFHGRAAKQELVQLYDKQVSLARRKKTLEKNAEGFRRALARGPRGSSSDSSRRSGSTRSRKSSKSSASSRPTENGWWCQCHVLNFTDPDLELPCWGCGGSFSETTCMWIFEPQPDDPNPWEIDMANPLPNDLP